MSTHHNILALAVASSCFPLALFSQMHASADPSIQPIAEERMGFMENKGQIVDQEGKRNDRIRFLLNTGTYNVQLRSDGFSYDFRGTDQREPIVENEITSWSWQYHRVDMTFEDASPEMEIVALDPGVEVTNHYCATCGPDGVLGVRNYRNVLYKNVRPGIDIEFRGNAAGKGGFEYDLIAQPGADISDLRIRVEGAPFKITTQGDLEMSTRFGEVIESIPASWFTTAQGEVPAHVRYVQRDPKHIGFAVDEGLVTFASTLTIDPVPTLLWSTYYGGESADEGHGVMGYSSGVYAVGQGKSQTVFGTSGAHQTTNASMDNWDAYLAKFSSSGTRLWSTYYGGTAIDWAYSVDIDPNDGNVVFVGASSSTSGVSTSGAHQTAFGGQADAIVAKFDASGVRQWVTYYGGSLVDRAFSVAIDGSGNIYVAGDAVSTNAISTVGAFQTTNGGQEDAFLVKFNSSGARQWGTYLGGSGHETYGVVVLDGATSVFMAGETQGSTSGIASSGSHQTSSGGSADCFLARFDPSGTQNWCTYYGGSGAEHPGTSISTDCAGGVTLCGETGSTSGIASVGAFQTTLVGATDAFVAKFNSSGVRTWGTYYGGSGSDDFNSVEVWTDANIYCAGATGSAGLATTGAHQTTYGGGTDGLVAIFNGGGSRTWCSYFGGSGQDRIEALSLRSGSVYLTGITWGAGMSTTGAHQTVKDLYNDAFITRFSGPGPIACPGEKSFEATGAGVDLEHLVFPNPTDGWVTISSSELPAGSLIDLYSPIGALVSSTVISGAPTYTLDLRTLPAGVYWLRYTFGDERRTVPVIKE